MGLPEALQSMPVEVGQPVLPQQFRPWNIYRYANGQRAIALERVDKEGIEQGKTSIVLDWTHSGRDFEKNVKSHTHGVSLERLTRKFQNVLENNVPKDHETPLFHTDVVFFVASGPSLKRNGHELGRLYKARKAGRAAVFALNSAPLVLPEGSVDYHCVLEDMHEENEKTEGWFDKWDASGATAYLSVDTVPWQVRAKYKERRWFRMASYGSEENVYRKRFPKMLGLDQGYTVAFSALHLIYLCRPSTIVFVGHDCSYPEDEGWHCEDDKGVDPTELGEDYDYGLDGRRVKTRIDYWGLRNHLLAACYWIALEGRIKIVNATEGGILRWPFRKPKSLKPVKLRDCVNKCL